MSKIPNCIARRGRCKMLIGGYFRLLGIKEFNQNLRNFTARMTESNALDSGLMRKTAAVLARAWGTAAKMQGMIAGCTIEVSKCIQ
jgi:hypothetical protein